MQRKKMQFQHNSIAVKKARLLALWIALAVWGSGCSSIPEQPALFKADESGELLWQRVETEHFVVESNLSNERRVRAIASDFETLWYAFASVPILGLKPPAKKPLVVVLRSLAEYNYLASERTAGYFTHGSLLGPLIVLPPNSGAFGETAVKHELAHFICSEFLPNAPLWLHEGLAQVMETAQYNTGAGQVLFGKHSLRLVHSAGLSFSAERFLGKWPSPMSAPEQARFYAKSWLLVHYLVDYELQGFLNMLVRISNGEGWQAAWDRELLLVRSADQIDQTLSSYHGRRRYGIWNVKAALPDSEDFECTQVQAAEALALRCVLEIGSPNGTRSPEEKTKAANRDLQEAFELNPKSKRVLRIFNSDSYKTE